jgi:two-component system cell cycle response regulator
MPETDLAIATQVAERLRAAVSRDPFAIPGNPEKIPVTISIGVTATGTPDDGPDTMMKRADVALYTAKARGRNCVIARPSPSPPRAVA